MCKWYMVDKIVFFVLPTILVLIIAYMLCGISLDV